MDRKLLCTRTMAAILAAAAWSSWPAAGLCQEPASVSQGGAGPEISPPPAPGQGKPVTLEQSLEKVIKQNPQIVSGEMSIEAAISARKAMISNFLPQMSADLLVMYYSEKPSFGSFDMGTTPDPSICLAAMDEADEQLFCQGLYSMFGGFTDLGNQFQAKQYDVKVTVQVAQPLTPLYQAYHGYKLADLGVDMARIEQDKVKADLKMKTVETYYGYLKAKAALKAVDEALVGVASHVGQAKAFYEAEFITKNDFLQAEVRQAQLEGQRLQIEQGVVLAGEGLLLVLNEQGEEPLVPVDDPEGDAAFLSKNGIPDEKAALDLAAKNRPELQQIDKAIAASSEAVKLAKGGWIPTVAAFASYQHEEGSVMTLPPITVGATVSWNFWQWGKVYYTVDEAKSKTAAAEAGREALEKLVVFEVKQALLAIALAKKEIEIQKKAVAAAEEQLRIEKDRYDKKVNTSTEVLDATARLVQSQVELASYKYEYLVAIARLKKACGTL